MQLLFVNVQTEICAESEDFPVFGKISLISSVLFKTLWKVQMDLDKDIKKCKRNVSGILIWLKERPEFLSVYSHLSNSQYTLAHFKEAQEERYQAELSAWNSCPEQSAYRVMDKYLLCGNNKKKKSISKKCERNSQAP